MRLRDILQHHYEPTEKFAPKHSENDLISDMKKILLGSHVSTLGLKCISTDAQLQKGLLLFKDTKKSYKIDLDGKYYEGTKEIGHVTKSNDLHSQYSSALHELIKHIKEEE